MIGSQRGIESLSKNLFPRLFEGESKRGTSPRNDRESKRDEVPLKKNLFPLPLERGRGIKGDRVK